MTKISMHNSHTNMVKDNWYLYKFNKNTFRKYLI